MYWLEKRYFKYSNTLKAGTKHKILFPLLKNKDLLHYNWKIKLKQKSKSNKAKLIKSLRNLVWIKIAKKLEKIFKREKLETA